MRNDVKTHIPAEWKNDKLYQEFNVGAHAAHIFDLVQQHQSRLNRLEGAELIEYCEKSIRPYLPTELIQIADDIKSGKTHTCLIRGLKFGEDESIKADRTPVAVTTMVILNALLNAEPMRNDKNEVRVDDIYPQHESSEKQIRSAGRLDYHNDAMAAVRVSDFGAVACIQSDPKATLDIHYTDHIKGRIGQKTTARLSEEKFWFYDPSHMRTAVEAASHMHDQPDHPSLQLIKTPYAVFDKDTARYSQDTDGLKALNVFALRDFRNALTSPERTLSLHLQNGDVVLRNNRTTVYGRSECENFGDAEDVSLLIRQRALTI